jgi:quercetin dioxygenase-like cupin family protein
MGGLPLAWITKSSTAALVIGLAIGWGARSGVSNVVAQRRTPLVITRIFTGADGQARIEDIETMLSPGAGTPPSAGSIDASQPVNVTEVQALRTSPGYVADWHPVRRRQYVVMVSGRREIEVADGKKIALSPGSVMLVEDTTGKGHLTRGLGTEDAISLIIPLAESR